jgi:hypothetical protein
MEIVIAKVAMMKNFSPVHVVVLQFFRMSQNALTMAIYTAKIVTMKDIFIASIVMRKQGVMTLMKYTEISIARIVIARILRNAMIAET